MTIMKYSYLGAIATVRQALISHLDGCGWYSHRPHTMLFYDNHSLAHFPKTLSSAF